MNDDFKSDPAIDNLKMLLLSDHEHLEDLGGRNPRDSNREQIYARGNGYVTVEENKNISATYRKLLLEYLETSKSQKLRHAAARALLVWPEKDYGLRVAEWGVWMNDHGKMKLAESSIDSNPKFVHTTGNKLSGVRRRIDIMNAGDLSKVDSDVKQFHRFARPTHTCKPVINIYADRPMAVDIHTKIQSGQPWFAYPVPDDLSAMISSLVELETTRFLAAQRMTCCWG